MAPDPEDLSPAEIAVLTDLVENGRDRVLNVAERQGMHRVTASRAVGELEKAGYAHDAGVEVPIYEATEAGQSVVETIRSDTGSGSE
jgi:DNA-binding MarR family transcriptional regulator